MSIMAKRGPKGKNIDLELLEKLASIHCTNTEMAAFFGCDSSLLSKPKYSELILKGRERGKISLRRKMMDTAMNGNVTMQIWLSKQYLGMADKQELKTDTNLTVESDKFVFLEPKNAEHNL
jgi:hypothetical protein